MKKILALVSLIFVLAGCKTVSEEITSTSPDGKNTIKVSGTKNLSVAFQTQIILVGTALSDTLITEIYSGDLNKETVKFDWKDNETCLLEFSQTDKPRKMVASFANEGLRLSDMK